MDLLITNRPTIRATGWGGESTVGAHPKFIHRISFSHQDLCVHPSSIFLFGRPPQPGWKIDIGQVGVPFERVLCAPSISMWLPQNGIEFVRKSQNMMPNDKGGRLMSAPSYPRESAVACENKQGQPDSMDLLNIGVIISGGVRGQTAWDNLIQ
jgi:hypothetical protein